ncbi:hypothetical protein L915_21754 [Phytophthora nicotianae]|uniref:Uncharacterized protein n=1 Tax=Phytophthora nicotianae TaxID=4792 RepID=W2FJL0_PHYNI|nr:hypothetical protein L915_21754 [Phytophthora nicotianae]
MLDQFMNSVKNMVLSSYSGGGEVITGAKLLRFRPTQ